MHYVVSVAPMAVTYRETVLYQIDHRGKGVRVTSPESSTRFLTAAIPDSSLQSNTRFWTRFQQSDSGLDFSVKDSKKKPKKKEKAKKTQKKQKRKKKLKEGKKKEKN